jgi:hypothetical protein
MRSFFALVAAVVVALAPTFCQTLSGAAQPEKITWAIVIHGGAGGKGTTTPADQPLSAREQLIADHLKIGCDVLSTGGSALDACEKVVRAFEDSGKFNTGKGATSTGKGTYALDASIMPPLWMAATSASAPSPASRRSRTPSPRRGR